MLLRRVLSYTQQSWVFLFVVVLVSSLLGVRDLVFSFWLGFFRLIVFAHLRLCLSVRFHSTMPYFREHYHELPIVCRRDGYDIYDAIIWSVAFERVSLWLSFFCHLFC